MKLRLALVKVRRIFAAATTCAAIATAVSPDFQRTTAYAGDTKPSGKQIYAKQCVRCHGAAGAGTDECKRALVGDKSVAQLARLIAKTMPEDDPGTCVGDDAKNVAAYIYDSFYSKDAQARNTPPRIEPARLTVRQYQNSVADLVESFRGEAHWDAQRGLKGEYFKSRDFRGDRRVLARVDPEIKFDFGVGSPDPKLEAQRFAIRWEGAILAPETGDHEIIVHTEHAVSVWVNDRKKPLIDAVVKSGNDHVHTATIRLLAGRVYPIRIEFSKAKQGVDDSKDKKKKPPPDVKASIRLEWKPPGRTAEVIPSHNLTPKWFPESYVVSTPFPPDDRSVGYERGTSISKAWEQAVTDAAIETADYVAAHLRDLSNVPDDAKDRADKLREFALKLAERAFRRPLDDEQKARYIDRQFKQAKELDVAVKRVVMIVLTSPRFLYRELVGGDDAWNVAARLAFELWDSLPDNALREAAAAGKLATREQVAQQAERMSTDLRTRSKIRDFLFQWLRVERNPDIAKNPKLFPGFDPNLVSDLRTSLDLGLEDLVWSDASDFRRLLLSNEYFLNGRLAAFYGVKLPADAPFQKVKLDPDARAGVLSHPYLLANFAYTAASSPIHRGVFIVRSLLGRTLRPPPEAVAPLAPDLHPSLTTRQRVTLQTSPAACVTCHGTINPLGFGLEHFDAVGRYRLLENGKPIDASGTYERPSGEVEKYDGARSLAKILAASDETSGAFVEQLFHNLVKQPVRAYGPRAGESLRAGFASSNANLRKLIVEIAVLAARNERDTKLAGKTPPAGKAGPGG